MNGFLPSAAKEICLSALMTALLLAGQYALSFVAGVEIVSVLLLSYSYSFGGARGATVAVAFSLLRCCLFGFVWNVLALYLIYYTSFALFWGGVGRRLKKRYAVVLVAMLCTACFTLLDDLLWSVFGGLNARGAWAYFLASLPVMGVQTLCTALTVSLLFPFLTKIFDKAGKSILK